ncbi:hypothetical protein ACFL0Q_02920 [Thermodesulfobacteriota bacterium]
MTEQKWLTRQDVLDIPQRDLPMLVLSDNLRSVMSARIKEHESGCYNHMMWMRRPGFFASQDRLFREVPAEKYLDRHRFKF